MTRRSRVRFVLALAVLGVPAVVVAAGLWYLGGGHLEQRIVAEWAQRFPGRLHVGSLRLADTDRAEVHGLRLDIDGLAKPLLTTTVVEARGALHRGEIAELRTANATIVVDRGALAWAREFAAALQRLPQADTAMAPLRLDLSGLNVDIAERMRITGLAVSGTIDGPSSQVRLTGQLGGEAFDLTLAGSAGRWRITAARLAIDVPKLIEVLDAFGVRGVGAQVQRDVAEWSPRLAHLDGFDAEFDPAAGHLRTLATAQPYWQGGRGQADLVLDADGLVLTSARADDAGLGQGEGRLHIAIPGGDLTVDLTRFTPGPRLKLPGEVPAAAILAHLPAAHLSVRQEVGADAQRHPHLNLTLLPAGADVRTSPTHLDISWTHDQALRIYGEGLPLPLAQAWLPAGLQAGAGRIHAFYVHVDERVREVRARVHGGELRWSGWTFSGLELAVSVLPIAAPEAATTPAAGGERFATTVHLPGEAVFGWSGSGAAATMTLAMPRIEDVLPHLRGPHPLPPLTGGIELRADLAIAADAIKGQLKHVACSNLTQAGVVERLTTSARGSIAHTRPAGTTALKLDGQLTSGRVRLPAGWLDLAARTPTYVADIAYRPERIVLKELNARAADAHGKAIAGAFTLGLKGEVDGRFSGRLHGVIDHANLPWVKANSSLIAIPSSVDLAGEGAATFTATLVERAVDHVEGWFLPLNTDLSLFDGALKVDGITGAVRFQIARPGTPLTPDPAPPAPKAP